MGAIRVFVADDQRLFREAARFAMAQHRDLTLVAESDLADAVAGAVESAPDVAVLGFGKDDSRQECLESVARLREQIPDCPVAAFFDPPGEDIELVVQVLELGAAGFISRRCSGAEYVTALRWLHNGGALIPRALLEDVASALAERRLEVERTIRLEEPSPHETRARPSHPPSGDEAD